MSKSKLNAAEAKNRLADLLNRVAYGNETFTITRQGRPLARLVPIIEEKQRRTQEPKLNLRRDDPFFKEIEDLTGSKNLESLFLSLPDEDE